MSEGKMGMGGLRRLGRRRDDGSGSFGNTRFGDDREFSVNSLKHKHIPFDCIRIYKSPFLRKIKLSDEKVQL